MWGGGEQEGAGEAKSGSDFCSMYHDRASACLVSFHFLFFWLCHVACQIFPHQGSSAFGAQSPNHWTTREVHIKMLLMQGWHDRLNFYKTIIDYTIYILLLYIKITLDSGVRRGEKQIYQLGNFSSSVQVCKMTGLG